MLPVDAGEVRFMGRDLKGLSDADRERLLGAEIGWACRTGPGRMAFNVRDYVGLQLIRGHSLRSRGSQGIGLMRCWSSWASQGV